MKALQIARVRHKHTHGDESMWNGSIRGTCTRYAVGLSYSGSTFITRWPINISVNSERKGLPLLFRLSVWKLFPLTMSWDTRRQTTLLNAHNAISIPPIMVTDFTWFLSDVHTTWHCYSTIQTTLSLFVHSACLGTNHELQFTLLLWHWTAYLMKC